MITLCMVVRNEAQLLGACLKQINDFVNEIVIVDQSSTDETVEVARKFTSRVYIRPRAGIPEADRQFSIDRASFPWILILDPDEVLDDRLKNNFQQLMDSGYEAFWIPRKNFIDGRYYGNAGDDLQLRFFKKGAVTWPPVVHVYPILHTDKVGRVNDGFIIHSRSFERLKKAHCERNRFVDERVRRRETRFIEDVEKWLHQAGQQETFTGQDLTADMVGTPGVTLDLATTLREFEASGESMTDEEAIYRFLHELSK